MDKIRNLSIRKTIVLYMAVCLLCCFFLSALVMRAASEIQNQIWWKYVDEEKYFEMASGEGIIYMVDVPRPKADDMSKTDHHISEFCDFLQTYSVLFISILGSCVAVYLFYKKKLQVPIEELALASQKIGENDLDFHIIYENKDEMGKLCREFERMRGQLEKNNRRLWRTIEDERALRAAISHDIRSPLSVLKGYQEMLIEYFPQGEISSEQTMEIIQESNKQIRRMDEFVETMRKMSSLDARQLVKKEISAEELKKDIQAEAYVLQKNSSKHCKICVSGGEEIFCGDKEIILEVIENLLSNALRYAKKQVEINLSVTYGEITVSVKDDGAGFQDKKEETTALFYQQNMKDSLKHAGIGMYISRLYCEKHGGALSLKNGEYGGAAITATFRRIV